LLVKHSEIGVDMCMSLGLPNVGRYIHQAVSLLNQFVPKVSEETGGTGRYSSDMACILLPKVNILVGEMCKLNMNEKLLRAPSLCVDACGNVRFEVFTAVTVKNAVFWDVTPCGSCKNRQHASVASYCQRCS
jgi:hypothetical protein